jgi:1-aminocyclopropane-1-carboxylate deaminase/D-cysteine desulfhydrase-like pyridoxal-dependent ACC family enzyme
MTNVEIRRWYLERVAHIAELNARWIAEGIPLRERAELAMHTRRELRLSARAMMTNPVEVELLRARDMAEYGNPNGPTFEFLLERLEREGLVEDAVYEAIISGSYRTNEGMNKKLGL